MPDQPETPPPPAKAIVEVFIAMNEKGDFRVDVTAEEAADRLHVNCGGDLTRIVKRTYLMSPPKVLDAGELDDIPDDPSTSAELLSKHQDGETTKVESA